MRTFEHHTKRELATLGASLARDARNMMALGDVDGAARRIAQVEQILIRLESTRPTAKEARDDDRQRAYRRRADLMRTFLGINLD